MQVLNAASMQNMHMLLLATWMRNHAAHFTSSAWCKLYVRQLTLAQPGSPTRFFLSLESGFDNRKILLFRYVPGPVLHLGVNEVILLEVEAAPSDPTGDPIQDYPIQLDHHL